jgi:ferritin-like metal-binding protein YciE
MATTDETPSPDRLRDLFITGLKNAHALEKQALSIMEPQVSRIENYPEMADRLQAHIRETHGQIERIDQLLDMYNAKASMMKDMATSMSGGMAAIGHSLFNDEIIKNSFANYAFEHFEIAAYSSLITIAEDAGFRDATSFLQQNLREEQAMAEWIEGNLPMVTRRYMELYAREGSMEAKV